MEKERIARTLYEAWNDRDFDRSAALMHDDAEITLVGSGARFTGPDGLRQFDRMWADAFPDGRITVDRLLVAGECAVVEFTGRGTQTGTLDMGGTQIPATGRSVTLQLCDVIEFRGAKIQSVHSYMDSGSLMAQLGVTQMEKATA